MTRPSLRRLSFGIALVLVSGLAARPQDRPSSGPTTVGKVTDREGIAAHKGLVDARWSAADAGTSLVAGDWLKTGVRGANALAVELDAGALLLGPGALVEVVDGGRVRLHAGEVELTPRAKGKLVVDGTPPRDVTARTVFRTKNGSTSGAFEALAQDPRWLTGYRQNASTDAVGALVATVDGRDVALTLGYHKVTVDIRDQVARTEIEESFVNHTGSRLEGVFYFPLPPDASISGFAMWIGDQQVHGEIVEKQRARAIFETILREKRDPALLEWSGGNLFKARVFPIEAWSQKRIKLTYTQVLAQTIRSDGKGELVYRHALASEHLRLHPLAKLAISVTVSSQRPIVDVSSPTHVCRVQKTEHAARAEHEAEQVSPDRDFELRIGVTRPASGLTLASHRRGDDGYFLLVLDAPPVAATATSRQDEPVELLVLADTSGSLAGAAREAQVRFVAALLEALGPKDTLNLATCDVAVSWAFDRPRESTPVAREEALGLLEGRRPLGWTDLDRAIAAAAGRAGPRTHIVYVGDGAITTGDADAQAFARRAPALYAGKGTFHAVVPGSTSETAALQAIAALGGGTVRTIGGSEPEDVAFALLKEILAPCAKELRLRFEGLEVAAVYPEVLPTLPAGAQQVVVGRWNAATAPADGQRGRVTLTGTLGDTKLSTTHEIALGAPVTTGEAEAPEDASFIPRLWARAHLEHLLSQGSSKELQAKVVALSEEFQLITPYTSFLVLESDADRARFQVKKRLRIRDGEEFFAKGRVDAEQSLTQQAMVAARSWRQNLRRRTLDDLADMGREESVEALRRVLPDGVALAPWLNPSRMGGGTFSFDLEEESDGDAEEEEPRFEGLDEPLPSEAEEEEEEELEEDSDGEAEQDAMPYEPSDDDAEGEDTGSTMAGGVLSFDDSGSGAYSYSNDGSFSDLLPSFWEPWRPEITATPGWSKEARDALASVDLASRVARAQGGLRIRGDVQRRDSRGRLRAAGSSLHLLAGQRWAECRSSDGEPTSCNWLAPSLAGGALERGVVAGPWGIGRVRPAVASDARGWEFPWQNADLLAAMADRSQATATARPLDGGQVEVTFTHHGVGPWGEQSERMILVIEPARGVLRSMRFPGGEAETVTWDVAEVAGTWFPSRQTCTDAAGTVTELTAFAVEALAPAAFEEAFAATLSMRASCALFGPLPTRRAARAAVKKDEARLEDRWVLLARLETLDRWDLVREHLDPVIGALPAPAGEAIRATALRLSHRQEELRLHLRGLADALVASPRADETSIALELLAWAEDLGTEEQLDLIARVRPVIERHPDEARAARVLGCSEAEKLHAVGRADEALARLRALAAAEPEDHVRHLALAGWLHQAGETDAAVACLDEALAKHGPWPVGSRAQLTGKVIAIWTELEDDSRVVAYAERLEREDPESASAVAHQHLTALAMLDRGDEVEARLRAWIEAALASPVGRPARTRLDTAVRFMLESREPLSDRHAGLLAQLVHTQWERDDVFELARRITHDRRWNEHPIGRATITTLIERLRKTAGPLVLPLLHLVHGAGPAAHEAPREVWDGVLDRLEARMELLGRDVPALALAGVLRGALEYFGDDGRRLRLLRQDHSRALVDGDTRPAAAALLGWLLEREWSDEAQREAVALLIELRPQPRDDAATAEARRVEQALALHRFVDWATVERADQEVAAQSDLVQLDRRRLRRATDEALAAARLRVLELLATVEEHAPSLRDWLTLERAWLQVKLGRLGDEEAARAAALALLDARLARTSTAADDAAMAERVVSMLLRLAGNDEGATQAANVAALSARLDRGVAAKDALVDWRQARVSLFLVCDRLDDAEVALRDASRTAPWGFVRACLLAERDRLAEAAAVIEDLASEDEVGPRELQTLSTWYTALDRPDAARSALARAWALVDAWRIEESLYREVERVSPDDEGVVPEALDPATELKLVALTRKTSPGELVEHVRSLYEPTRDFRLLGALAEGVLGQSAENVYALLGSVQGLTELLQEEATLDHLRRAIAAVQGRRATPQDARALRLLELVALCGAVAQEDPQKASAHADAALVLLRDVGAPEGAWGAGEPLLYAELLVAQGPLPGALGDERVRQLQALVRLAPDPTARLKLTGPLATVLMSQGRPDDAARALSGALDAARGPDGLLPRQLHWALQQSADLLMSMGRFCDAEALYRRELEPSRHGPRATQGLRYVLHRIRLATLAKGAEGLAGSGSELYRVAQAELRADLVGLSSSAYGDGLFTTLCELWTAGAPYGPVRDDVKRFAFTDLPGVLARQRASRAWGLTDKVIEALLLHADAVTALELLVLRAESEPVSVRLRGHDLWSRLGGRFGELRARAGAQVSPTLALRLLELTKAELRRVLRGRTQEYPSICGQAQYGHFWREHLETWKRVAREVLAEHRDDLATVFRVASFLRHRLGLESEPIDVLLDADRRGVLDWNARQQLCQWLRDEERFAEALVLSRRQVVERPDHLEGRLDLARALFGTGEKEQALQALNDAEAYLREVEAWHDIESALGVGGAYLAFKEPAGTVRVVDAALTVLQRADPEERNHDSAASLYELSAEAHAQLGETAVAVDAACGALLARGAHLRDGFGDALALLEQVLVASPALDDYVAQVDREERETGLENATLRRAIGNAYRHLRQPGPAEANLRRALAAAPNDVALRGDLVELLDQLERPADAVEELLALTTIAGHDADRYVELGQRWHELDELELAERAWTNLVEQLPHEAESHQALAELREQQERLPEAVEQWRQVVRVRTDEPWGWFSLARALLRIDGKRDEVRALMRQVLATTWDDRFGDVQPEVQAILEEADAPVEPEEPDEPDELGD